MLKSYAKINIFLKITGKMLVDGTQYHALASRFMLVENLFDCMEISLGAKEFQLLGNFDCENEQNTIYKAYKALLPFVNSEKKEILSHLKVEVEKKIPSGAGLGGGSSNAGVFLRFINTNFELNLSTQTLNKIASFVGSDVPFFASGEKIANVSGRGEIIESYKEAPFSVEIFYPQVHCDTKEVYQNYAKKFYKPSNKSWLNYTNTEILQNSPLQNNDLLQSVLDLYPNLKEYANQGYFLSGSGSCFWQAKDTKNEVKSEIL